MYRIQKTDLPKIYAAIAQLGDLILPVKSAGKTNYALWSADAQVDIETNLYFAQEAVASYLLSLQEETFCGYSVDALVEAAQELDPME